MSYPEFTPESDRELALSIILPAFNEEGAVGDTVKSIKALNIPYSEIIVVNDGSSDKTAEVAEASGARVISHPYNIGNGASVKSGIRGSRGRVLVFLDADGQHSANDIFRLVPLISRYHMVVGARSKESDGSLHRNMANWFYNKLASFIADFNIQDLTSGFRVMRRDDAVRFCDMFPNTFSYPTTSTLAFVRSGRAIAYVPIVASRRIGKSKIRLFSDGFEFLMIILKIAMTFAPFRIFLPMSAFLFGMGLARYAYTYILYGNFTNMAHLLLNSSVIVFMLGLIAEQIAALRFERGDKIVDTERGDRYSWFSTLGSK